MIEIKNLNFAYQDSTVYEDLNISFDRDKLYAVVGRSGCGKTTLMRLIAGLEDTTEGEIIIDDVKVNGQDYVRPHKRNVAMVFQDYALFPHLTVEKNIKYGNKDNKDFNEIVDALEIKGLINKKPYQLSGGQQQRVAIARGLMAKPGYLLLDEPFSNLDAQTLSGSKNLISKLAKQYGIGIIIISHHLADYDGFVDEIVDFNKTSTN